MNKKEFLHILKSQLKGIPEEDIQEIVADYNEHFDVGLSQGRNEEEIARSLGQPKVIAKELRANFLVNQANESFSVGNFFNALLATIGLGFFNLVFVLGPFLGIFGAIVGLIVSSVAIVFTGLVLIITSFWSGNIVLMMLLGIAMICLGLILTILLIKGCMWFFKMTIRYLQANIDIIKKRRDRSENI